MPKRIRLGILVPSSNTALEPLTSSIISSITTSNLKISVHYSRFRVTQISLSPDSNAQFKHEQIVEAARLLADAKVDVIGWSGTSAGWLGFEDDEKLCAAIEKDTDVPATTSVLGLNRILERIGCKELGLVTPYVKEMNERIRTNYRGISVEIPKGWERHLGMTVNTTFADIGEETLDEMVEDVVKAGAKDVTTF